MKLSEDVLVEIIDILRKGLVDQVDISDLLRDLDLEVQSDTGKLSLTASYMSRNGRTG